jgi:hypothetical protein
MGSGRLVGMERAIVQMAGFEDRGSVTDDGLE